MGIEGFFAEKKRGTALDEYPPFYVRGGHVSYSGRRAVTLITNGFDVKVKPIFGVRLNYLTTRLRPLLSVLFDYLLSAFWFAAFVLLNLRNSIYVPNGEKPTHRSICSQAAAVPWGRSLPHRCSTFQI
jgi:hypothetical protein